MVGADITLAGIACIIMREVYASIGESIYQNPSFLSRDFPEASGRVETSRRHLGEYTGTTKSSRFKIWLTGWNDD